ncbi:MAG: hypothetical protein P8Q97_13735 [Myxococcota bacterium]|nr:hypothetical protein [Myxococcota bacterium]
MSLNPPKVMLPPPSAPRRTPKNRPLALRLVAAVLFALVGAGAPMGHAQLAPSPNASANPLDGPVFAIDDFVIEYAEASPELPPLDEILPLTVPLRVTPTGYAAPLEGEPSQPIRIGGPGPQADFHASALGAISRTLLSRFHALGILGVYVRPNPADIALEEEIDLRAPGDYTLRLGISVARVMDVRTVAVGGRVQTGWRINNPAHRAIRKESPLGPTLAGRVGTTDRIDQRRLEDYLYALNRHPGRQVEAALAASDDDDGVTLDYRVYEERPWSVYAQAGNTGTERTGLWQTRLGYVHRQLTNRDDILSINYLNADLDNVNSIQAAYEAPWFGEERADWMVPGNREPSLLKLLNRDKIPWWGVARLRWNLTGGWTRISSDVVEELPGGFDAADSLLSSDWHVGGGLTYNAFQYRNFFLDLIANTRFRGVQLDNKSAGNLADVTLAVFDMGFKFDRSNAYSSLFGRIVGEYATALGSPADNAENFGGGLGRASTDSDWWVIQFEAGLSQYLEPLLWNRAWRNPNTPGSSTLSHEVSLSGRGQYAFDYRLIPQSSQVIGGLYSVRGFPQGVAVGDSVYMGTAEYAFHLPRSLPISREPLKLPWVGDFRLAPQQVYGRPDWDLVFRGFVDVGKSIRNNPQLGSGTELNQFLVGAGAGVEFVYKGNFTVRVDWARGIHQEVDCSTTTALGSPDLGCLNAKSESTSDDNGTFYFLINGVW